MASEGPTAAGVVRALPYPAILVDGSKVIVAANVPFLEQWAAAYSHDTDLVGRSLRDLDQHIDATLLDHLKGDLPAGTVRLLSVSIWRPDEHDSRLADLTIMPFDDGSKLMLVEVSTEESQLESHRERSGRLAILGRCAAGFAHDINNQLSATLNVASLVREELGPEHDHVLSIIEGSSREAAALAHRMLRFGGHGDVAVERDSIDQVVERAVSLVRHELPPRERFAVNVTPPCPNVQGDLVLLEQLVATLLMIAADALCNGGRGSLTAYGDAATGRVAISLSLDRTLDAEDALGPARRIVDRHGGALLVTEADGLRIDVSLPTESPIASAAPPVVTPEGREDSHKRIVLVVDDDPMVRNVAVAMVQRLGFSAIPAEGGLEAIELLGREGMHVDLILLDVVMQDLDGLTTLSRIREVSPDVKVVLSSGFGEPIGIDDLLIDGTLEKPYSMAALKRALELAFTVGSDP